MEFMEHQCALTPSYQDPYNRKLFWGIIPDLVKDVNLVCGAPQGKICCCFSCGTQVSRNKLFTSAKIHEILLTINKVNTLSLASIMGRLPLPSQVYRGSLPLLGACSQARARGQGEPDGMLQLGSSAQSPHGLSPSSQN